MKNRIARLVAVTALVVAGTAVATPAQAAMVRNPRTGVTSRVCAPAHGLFVSCYSRPVMRVSRFLW